jgi:hypothetical protein
MQVADIQQLAAMKEGEMFELGSLMPNLDGGQEKVVWQCLENMWMLKEQRRRLTLHAYYYDTFLMPAVVHIDGGCQTMDWRFG